MPFLKWSFRGKKCHKSSTSAKSCCQNFIHTKWPQHVTAFLWEPQWLPVKYQIDFKIAWWLQRQSSWELCIYPSQCQCTSQSLPVVVKHVYAARQAQETSSLRSQPWTRACADHSPAFIHAWIFSTRAANVSASRVLIFLHKAHQNLKNCFNICDLL